jgi:DedD protein
MPLPQFFQRFRPGASEPLDPVQPLSEADIEQARVKARRRMVGMAVLVAAGVVGFPWLFETQPRPLNGEVQVVSQVAPPAAASTPMPIRPPVGALVAPRVADGTARETIETIEPPAPRSASVPASAPAEQPPTAVAPRQNALTPSTEASVAKDAQAKEAAAKEAAKEAAAEARAKAKAKAEEKARAEAKAKADEKTRAEAKAKADEKTRAEAKAKAEEKAKADKLAKEKDKDKPKDKAASDSDTRYVVQVGAFNDADSAQAVRQKVEKLGIKTYAQVIDSAQGKKTRVRVGPFTNKADAEKTLATLKKAGLNAGVLTL